jgi:hypothetical protein
VNILPLTRLKKYMENTPNADELTVEKAQEVVENDDKATVVEETVTLPKAQVDELILAAEKATELATKKSADAENYKKGMLIAKGKLKDNGIDDEEETKPTSKDEIAQMIRDAVKEVLPEVVKPKVDDDEITAANNKLAEMRLVMANSRKGSPSSAGSNAEKDLIVKSDAQKHFSPEQIAEIQKNFPGINIDDVYKHLANAGNMSGAPRE